MKENNLWLSPEELHYMLKGSLQWLDVAPRLNEPKNGFRKLREAVPQKESPRKQTEIESTDSASQEIIQPFKGLDGQPVIWLLGSVGFLTLSTWFYFLIF